MVGRFVVVVDVAGTQAEFFDWAKEVLAGYPRARFGVALDRVAVYGPFNDADDVIGAALDDMATRYLLDE